MPSLRAEEGSLARFVTCRKLVGEGHFSVVYQATCTAPGAPNVVAVKLLKAVDAESVARLEREVGVMSRLRPHPHVVRYLGHSVRTPALVIEYCDNGDLKRYLLQMRQQLDCSSFYSWRDASRLSPILLSYARQIVLGMEYLASEGVVHGDVAARNVLVGEGGRVAKISDFGLARPAGDSPTAVEGGVWPYKWMAPEAVQAQRFSERSDVWSFGVVLWEIVTVGGSPYGETTPVELMHKLNKGYRMPRPTTCSYELYEVMLDCWELPASVRPSFATLRGRLERLMERQLNYMNLHTSTNTVYYKNLMDVVFTAH